VKASKATRRSMSPSALGARRQKRAGQMNLSVINANESVVHGSPRTMGLVQVQRYGLAILSVGLALGASLLLQHFHFRDTAVPLLLSAVAISSWYGGTGAAVVAAILSTVSFYWYFVEPVRTPYIYPSEIPYFMIFAAFATLISWFATIRRRTEEALREKADLLDLTHDTVFVMDMEGVIKYWNRGAEGLYGWTTEQAVSKVVHALLNTVFPVPREEIMAEVVRIGQWEGELVQTKKDGTQVTVASRWALQRDERGAPVAIMETNNDITQRQRAEEALRRLNRELRAISNCNQALLRATDEQSLLKEICRIVCEEAGYRVAWVGYADPDEEKSVRPVAWTGIEEGEVANLGVTWADTERGRGPGGTAIRTGKTCCVKDYTTDPEVALWKESALQHGFGSAIGLPLKDENANPFGSLIIYATQTNAFTPEEIRLLEELAADLAFGIVTLRSRAARDRAEQGLRQSEAYRMEAERLTHTGSWAVDVASDKYVYCSEEDLRIWGYDPQGPLPARETVFRQVLPEDGKRVEESYQKTLRDKLDTSCEYRVVLPNGTVKHVHVLRHPVLNSTGEVVKMVGTSMDITERKRAEEAVRESETRFRTFVDHATDAFFVLDEDNQHRVVDVNRHAYESLGYTREELIGMEPRDFDPSADAALFRSISERLEAEEVCTFETHHRRKDGTLFPVEVRVRRLRHGGRRLNLALARDITERGRAEQALRRSEAYLAEGQRLSHTGSWAWNPATRQPLYFSEEMFRIFGLNPQDGVPTAEIFWHQIHPEDFDRTYRLLMTAAEGNMEYEHDHRILLPNGTVKHLHAIGHPVVNENGNTIEYVGTTIDVTEQKRMEEQRQRLRQLEAELAHINRVSMLGELAASIAHEVNQPLSGVVSNGSACLRWLAADVPNLEEARETAHRIVRDGKRAAEVIARIRAMTKGAVTPHEKLELNDTIREVLGLVGDEAKKKSVIIRTQFADDLSPVSGDRVQLQQVMLNLVMNAIEAMGSIDERARELLITTRNVDPEQIQVTVEDSGPGIDPNTMDKIFDPFYTTKPGGMGMGLSISRSILQAHGGRLWAPAKDGPGTIFSFTLPIYQQESNAGASAV